MCQITGMNSETLHSLSLQSMCFSTPLTGGDSGEAEPGWQGPVPLREWGLERQRGRQVPPPRAAGAPSERPHLPELRRHVAGAQQRDGPRKTRQTHVRFETTGLGQLFGLMSLFSISFSTFQMFIIQWMNAVYDYILQIYDDLLYSNW